MSMQLQSITITFLPGRFEPDVHLTVGANGGNAAPSGGCTIMQHHINTLKDVAANIQRSVNSAT